MSATNLAQYKQYLKSLEQAIKEIGDRHKQMSDLLYVIRMETSHLCHHLHQSWSDVIMLFTWTDQLRCCDLSATSK